MRLDLDRFIDDPTSGLNEDSSRVAYRKTLRALQVDYPNHCLQDFTERDLVDWCSRAHLSPATIAGYTTRIHGFFSWALWQGLITEDPSANMNRIVRGSHSKPVREHNWLSTEDVSMVLDSIDTTTHFGLRDMIIARLGFTLGLRRGEIATLTWNQIDLERQQVTLRGKGGRLATLFLTDASLPWFQTWYESTTRGLGRFPITEPVIPKFEADWMSDFECEPVWRLPVGPDTISTRVRYISDQTIKFAPHDMRRSYANMLEEAGYTIADISTALRHSDLGTTQRYLDRRQDAAFQAVKEKGLSV